MPGSIKKQGKTAGKPVKKNTGRKTKKKKTKPFYKSHTFWAGFWQIIGGLVVLGLGVLLKSNTLIAIGGGAIVAGFAAIGGRTVQKDVENPIKTLLHKGK